MRNNIRFLTLLAAFIFTLSTLGASRASASVWQATQQWSPDVEAHYQEWVKTVWTKTIFTQPGPLQNVKLDCADAVYSMRLLFSYQNSLPFAVKDPSANNVISNDMTRFDSIKDPAKRFRAFAQFIYGMLGTTTLAEDSYPVAMNRTGIHAGVFLKTDHATHHSWTIHDIDTHGVPYLLFASRPALTTLLTRHGYPSMGFLWGEEDAHGNQVDANLQTPGDPATGVGFRMYRYPADILKPVWQIAGYSLDQYQMKRIDWSTYSQRALQLQAETPEELVKRLVVETCQEATDRIDSVQEALAFLAQKDPSYCMTTDEYDDYSTPSRDSRSVAVFQSLQAVYKTSHNGQLLTPATKARLESILNATDDGSFCPVQISQDERLTLGQVVSLGLAEKWSSNPNDSLHARWGEASSSAHATSCPAY